LEVSSELISPENELKLTLKGFENKNITIQRLNPNNPNDNSYLAYDIKDFIKNRNGTGIINLFNPDNPGETHISFELDFNSKIAHYPLDEAEGNIAGEKINNLDGIIIGSPNWQPEGGKVGGAILLNGIDNYIATPFILDPSEGPFSVYSWIKGGMPGQAIISQSYLTSRPRNGQTWLSLSPEGKLVTDLRDNNSRAPLIAQEPVITDNDWHHVGVVWDGSKRHLYIDGKQAAKDNVNLSKLLTSYGELYFGAGKNLELNSFWSGIIDNIRIYKLPVQDTTQIEGSIINEKNFEGFETRDFSKFQWVTYGGIISNPAPWFVTSDQAYSGNYCAKAVNTNKGGNTKIEVTLDCQDGKISFNRKLSSSYSHGLMFYIDNQMMDAWGGEKDWERFSYPVENGTRKFMWFYKQDGTISPGEAARIDNITFPLKD